MSSTCDRQTVITTALEDSEERGSTELMEPELVPVEPEMQAGGDHSEAMVALEQQIQYKTPIRKFRKKYKGPDHCTPRPAPPVHNCLSKRLFELQPARTPSNRTHLRKPLLSSETPGGVKWSSPGSVQGTPYPRTAIKRRELQPSSLRRRVLLKVKRSQSMVDLSPNGREMRDELAECLERTPSSVNSASTLATLSTMSTESANITADTPIMTETIQSIAARKITSWFLLKAYRRERQDNRTLRRTVGELTTAGEHLQMQIVVLKDLIEAERGRLDTATQEAAHCRMTAEAALKDNDALEKDNSSLKERVRALDERCESQLTAWRNLKNELQSCRESQAALEEQLKRERDKVAKLREDKRFLMDKVKCTEDTAMAKETEQQEKIVQIRDQLARKSEECERRTAELTSTIERQSCQITQLSADLEFATRIPPKPEGNWRRMATLLSGAPLIAVHAFASQMLPALPPPGIIGL